jgi:hypothetical protein
LGHRGEAIQEGQRREREQTIESVEQFGGLITQHGVPSKRQHPSKGMDMRFVTMMFACLIGFAALAGCVPTTAQGCPPGTPWVAADYANGKWVPAHCLGQPAQ